MQGVNIELIKARAREVRESLGRINSYAAQPDADFLADERNLYSVMHLLLVCIEAVASICTHLLAKAARQSPASYGECFERLHQLGLLDESLTERLIRMARFRNVLVHRYWEVDPARVLRYARENLGDFEDFLQAIARHFEQPGA